MRRASLYLTVLLLVAVGMMTSEAQAFTLSLSSTTDLTAPLPKGAVTTISVNLSGLAATDQLSALDVAVAFTNLEASNFQWGGIVPKNNRWDSIGTDEVSGSFWADENANNLSSDGVNAFFSFDASFPNAGAGEISFSAYPLATQVGDPDIDLNAFYPDQIACDPALSFTVTPEPSAYVLFTTAALAAGAYSLKRRISFTRF